MSGIPEGAVFDGELAKGIALYDVTHVLPRHPRKLYAERDPAQICRVYHHHSGALGKPGFDGARRSARYVVESRDWPGFAYTFWLAYEADRDPEDRRVVYRCNRDETRSYHTGAQSNTHGVAVCWQGNLREREPSEDQQEMAEALYAWTLGHYQLADDRPHSFHSEAGDFGGRAKSVCPGPHVEAWVRRRRGEGVG